jgi:hypothetical protein
VAVATVAASLKDLWVERPAKVLLVAELQIAEEACADRVEWQALAVEAAEIALRLEVVMIQRGVVQSRLAVIAEVVVSPVVDQVVEVVGVVDQVAPLGSEDAAVVGQPVGVESVAEAVAAVVDLAELEGGPVALAGSVADLVQLGFVGVAVVVAVCQHEVQLIELEGVVSVVAQDEVAVQQQQGELLGQETDPAED